MRTGLFHLLYLAGNGGGWGGGVNFIMVNNKSESQTQSCHVRLSSTLICHCWKNLISENNFSLILKPGACSKGAIPPSRMVMVYPARIIISSLGH